MTEVSASKQLLGDLSPVYATMYTIHVDEKSCFAPLQLSTMGESIFYFKQYITLDTASRRRRRRSFDRFRE